jgi:hypothetical protein
LALILAVRLPSFDVEPGLRAPPAEQVPAAGDEEHEEQERLEQESEHAIPPQRASF